MRSEFVRSDFFFTFRKIKLYVKHTAFFCEHSTYSMHLHVCEKLWDNIIILLLKRHQHMIHINLISADILIKDLMPEVKEVRTSHVQMSIIIVATLGASHFGLTSINTKSPKYVSHIKYNNTSGVIILPILKIRLIFFLYRYLFINLFLLKSFFVKTL